jgi:hypothetical protein
MQLDIGSRSILDSRAARHSGSGIHDIPREGTVPFDSQPWGDPFIPLSNIELGLVTNGQSFNTSESAIETFPPPAAPTMWAAEPRLYDSSSGSMTETPHEHAKQPTLIYQNAHNSVVLQDDWDMKTPSYPQPSHLLNFQPSSTDHEVSTAEVGSPYPYRVGDGIESDGWTMGNHGSHSSALYSTMTFAQGVSVESTQTSENLNFTNESRSALYDLSALPTRASALSMRSESEQPSSSSAECLGNTSQNVLHWSL